MVPASSFFASIAASGPERPASAPGGPKSDETFENFMKGVSSASEETGTAEQVAAGSTGLPVLTMAARLLSPEIGVGSPLEGLPGLPETSMEALQNPAGLPTTGPGSDNPVKNWLVPLPAAQTAGTGFPPGPQAATEASPGGGKLPLTAPLLLETAGPTDTLNAFIATKNNAGIAGPSAGIAQAALGNTTVPALTTEGSLPQGTFQPNPEGTEIKIGPASSGESPLGDLMNSNNGKNQQTSLPVSLMDAGEMARFSPIVQAAAAAPGLAGAPLKEESAKISAAAAPAGGVVEASALSTESGKALPLFDLPVKGAPGSALIDQIAHQISLRFKGGESEIQLKLDPPSLGTVRMNVAANGDAVRALIITDHLTVKQVIESQLPQLRETLASQGMKVDSFTVLVGGHDTGGGSHPSPEHASPTFSTPAPVAAAPEETDKPVPTARPAGRSGSSISIFA